MEQKTAAADYAGGCYCRHRQALFGHPRAFAGKGGYLKYIIGPLIIYFKEIINQRDNKFPFR